jgi:hypothetical protein
VAEGKTLTLGASGNLVIEGAVKVEDEGILDLATYQTAANKGSVTLTGEGTIEVAEGGTVRALEPATGQIDWGDGSIVFYNGSTLKIKNALGEATYLDPTEDNVPFTWVGTQDASIDEPRVILSKGLMTVDACLTSNNLPVGLFTTNWIDDEAIIASGKLTVATGKVLLVSDTASITVKDGAELAVTGTLAIEKTVSKLILEPGGKVSSTNISGPLGPFVGWQTSPSTTTSVDKVTVTVSDSDGTATKATLTTAPTNQHTLKTADAWSESLSLTLGKFKIAKPASGNIITGADAGASASAGTLIADAGT